MVRQLLGTSGRTLPVRKDKARQIVAVPGKNILDHVTRRFNASSAGLKKPVGLDLRWAGRFAISSMRDRGGAS
jgi:hypothetical protein